MKIELHTVGHLDVLLCCANLISPYSLAQQTLLQTHISIHLHITNSDMTPHTVWYLNIVTQIYMIQFVFNFFELIVTIMLLQNFVSPLNPRSVQIRIFLCEVGVQQESKCVRIRTQTHLHVYMCIHVYLCMCMCIYLYIMFKYF